MSKTKYKSDMVRVERGEQKLVFLISGGQFSVNLFVGGLQISRLAFDSPLGRDQIFDALLTNECIEPGDLQLQIDEHYIRLRHNDQTHQIDFNGPFTQKDILDAIHANRVDPKTDELKPMIDKIRFEINDLQISLNQCRERLRYASDQLEEQDE